MRASVRVLAWAAAVALPLAASAQERVINQSANPLLSNFRFRSIGPASMGGRIDDIEVSETDPNIIYLGYATGGVWKSVNNGTTFQPVFDEVSAASIGDIAIHPRNADIVYVGTGEPNNRQTSSFGDGIYKTTDGGKTWTRMGLDSTQSIGRVVIDPKNPETVYVAAVGHLFGPNADRGVYTTTDGGKTWNKILYVDENTGATDIAIDQSNSNILYAATYQRRRSGCCFNGGGPGSALWKTENGGRTWKKLTGNGLPSGEYGRLAIDVSRSNPSVVYVQIETSGGGDQPAAEGGGGRGGFDWCNNGAPASAGRGGRGAAAAPQEPPKLNPNGSGLYRSDNKGGSWRVTSNCNSRPMYFSQVRVDPTNPNTVYVAGLPWAKSTDGGKTFATLDAAGGNNTSGHVDQHAMYIDLKNPRHLLIGNDGGFNISWDQGYTWDFVNTMATGLAYWVSADMRRPYWVYTGLQDNDSWGGPSGVRSSKNIRNEHWFNVGGGDGFQTAVDPTQWNIIFTESQDGNTSRYDLLTGAQQSIRPSPLGGGKGGPADITADGCRDGSIVTAASGGRGAGGGFGGRGGNPRGNVLNADSGNGSRFNWNTPYALSPHDPRVLWYGGSRVYRSTNQGDAYTQSADLTKAVDRCKISLMGVAGNKQQLSKNDGVASYSTIIAIAESPARAGIVWAGTDDGNLQVSRDNGATFTEVGKNLAGLPSGALTGDNPYWISRIDPSHFDAATAYVAVDGHRSDDLRPYVFVTTDYGATFRSISANLPAYGNVQVVREDPKNPDLLYVGTEFGLFISLNRGQSWEKFMNNYPTVRTDDILVHPRDGDLIVGTHGRSVLIADDITALQQLTPKVRNEDAHLFDIRDAVAYVNDRTDNPQVAGQKRWEGENAPRGTSINYYLKNAASSAKLAISDNQGRELCSGDVATSAGINRVQWSLTSPLLAGQGGGGRGAGGRGGAAAAAPYTGCGPNPQAGGFGGFGGGGRGGFGGGVQPGTYTVTLTVNGKAMSKSVRVLEDVWRSEK
ncbi:MAG: hypothetical protein IT356_09655 [Gemmatimonadaceae bacterium]|nr:hypothetical protein [Gemmatimonadaceae bacterium]